MRVFILEDNSFKLNDIIHFLQCHFENIQIDSGEYLNVSIQKLIRGNYDYAILDNIVPRFSDSKDFVFNAASEVIEWLWLKQKNTKCIICSSELIDDIPNTLNYIGEVRYSYSSTNWENLMLKLLNK